MTLSLKEKIRQEQQQAVPEGGGVQRKNTKGPEDKFPKINFTDFTIVPKANSKQFVLLLSPNNGYEIWSDSLTVQFGSKI